MTLLGPVLDERDLLARARQTRPLIEVRVDELAVGVGLVPFDEDLTAKLHAARSNLRTVNRILRDADTLVLGSRP